MVDNAVVDTAARGRLVLVRAALLALACAAATLVPADGARACSCVAPDPAELLAEADGAFVGRLLAVKRIGGDDNLISSAAPAAFTYRIRRVVKRGPGLRRGRKVTVRSAWDGASCGLPRRRGRSYGLFLQRTRRGWSSHLCEQLPPRLMPSDPTPQERPTTPENGCG